MIDRLLAMTVTESESQTHGPRHTPWDSLQWRHNECDGVSIVCSTVCSSTNQRKHQRSASLAFVRGIHRWPVDSPHKMPVTPKIFPFYDVIMAEAAGRCHLTKAAIFFRVPFPILKFLSMAWINNYTHINLWGVIIHPHSCITCGLQRG